MPQQSYCPAYPVTDCHQNVSQYGMFYETIIGKLGPFTVGALIWDQAEADLSCNHTGAQYSCLETALVSSWRQGLGAREFPAVAVQLPGYSKDCASLVRKFGPNWDFCGGGSLLKMRLAQESGMRAVGAVGTHGVGGAVSATYDLSCPACPFGSVHNTDKASVGARVALQLRKLWFNDTMVVAEGPRVQSARHDSSAGSKHRLRLQFIGGSGPFVFKPTRNCTGACTYNPTCAHKV